MNSTQYNNNPRFSLYYNQLICPDLLLKLPIQNLYELPKIHKIVVHSSSGTFAQENDRILPTLVGLEAITGQKCSTTWSKKSIASFRLREKSLLGCRVTLRKSNLYRFFEKYTLIFLPRFYDWQPLSLGDKKKVVEPNRGYPNPFLFLDLEPFMDSLQGIQGFQLNWQIESMNFSKHLSVSKKEITPLLLSGFQCI